jgi:hypothetical protein
MAIILPRKGGGNKIGLRPGASFIFHYATRRWYLLMFGFLNPEFLGTTWNVLEFFRFHAS